MTGTLIACVKFNKTHIRQMHVRIKWPKEEITAPYIVWVPNSVIQFPQQLRCLSVQPVLVNRQHQRTYVTISMT